MAENWTTISVSSDTKEALRRQLRGGESWDRLLQKMNEQYDPDAAREVADEPEPA